MIPERMLEYLILADIEDSICTKDEFTENSKKYSMEKVRKRLNEIRQEILEPYALDSTSKE